jgi:hypothetical protein
MPSTAADRWELLVENRIHADRFMATGFASIIQSLHRIGVVPEACADPERTCITRRNA